MTFTKYNFTFAVAGLFSEVVTAETLFLAAREIRIRLEARGICLSFPANAEMSEGTAKFTAWTGQGFGGLPIPQTPVMVSKVEAIPEPPAPIESPDAKPEYYSASIFYTRCYPYSRYATTGVLATSPEEAKVMLWHHSQSKGEPLYDINNIKRVRFHPGHWYLKFEFLDEPTKEKVRASMEKRRKKAEG